jgi:sugar phosphate isomerase/epimerase
VGAPFVQMCTGPVDVRVVKEFRAGSLGDDDLRFRGALGLTGKDALADTARRVALAADIAADHGVSLYLEPLAWSPINRVSQALQIFETTRWPSSTTSSWPPPCATRSGCSSPDNLQRTRMPSARVY